MKISRTSFVAFSIAAVWAFVGVANANDTVYLPDGDFDELEVGTGPDMNSPAGAWEIAVNPGHPEDTEDDPNEFTIVPTSSFDRTSTGNSLRINQPPSLTSNTWIINEFADTIFEAESEIVRASFDVFVPDSGTSRRGGFGLILGDASRATVDRGPQLTWNADGSLKFATGEQIRRHVAVPDTPSDKWQHVQLDIDLAADTFDLFWSVDGAPLELVAPNAGFRGSQDALNYVALAIWPVHHPVRPLGEAYLDNVNIEVLQKTPGDANLDGVVDFPDFLALSKHFGEGSRRDPRGWSQGDFDGNGEVDFPDFLILSENFGAVAAASATSVPEPNAGSIALFGLLGLIGFRRRR